MDTMKAVLLDQPTKGADVRLSEIPVPAVKPGWVLVKVKAFGMNHSEEILREYIYHFMDAHNLRPLIGAVYDFADIREACIALDEGKVDGKIVARAGD